jgi:hypothetical protein
MATRKRAKTKKKSSKKSAKPRAKKKLLRTKAATQKAKARASKKPRAAARPATVKQPPAMPSPRPQTPSSLPGAPATTAMVIDGERIGTVTHYYSHLSVAIVMMERGSLRVGDRVHIKGHTTDFQQRVDSMEINHAHVMQVGPKQEFGMRVIDHAREHDVVYKLPT